MNENELERKKISSSQTSSSLNKLKKRRKEEKEENRKSFFVSNDGVRFILMIWTTTSFSGARMGFYRTVE